MDFYLSFEGLIGSLLALVALFLFFRSLLLETVIYIPEKTRHSWKNLQILNRSCYCSICEILLSDSKDVFCDCCGVAAHNPKCMKRADVYFKCKEKWTKNKSTNHLWVKGNLAHNLVCFHCNEEVDYHGSPGIFGTRCCWCQKSFHDDCFKKHYGDDLKSEKCDFGEFKTMIYPPSSIVAARTPGAVRLHLTEVNKPEYIENWSPLLVIANTKSGSSTATEVMSLLKGYLNPLQVMEISNKGPSEALKLTIKSCPTNSKILVAGGDGTVGWVLNTIKQMNIVPHPSIAIMPLGTGNDLSRVLGWGPEPPSTLDPLKILRSIQKAEPIKLDCFDMIVKQHKRLSLPKKSFTSKYQIYNYFSIGVDALVTYNFHKTRESPFYLLSSRLFNKMIYFWYGTQQIIQRNCEGLHDNLELYIDDKLIELPDLQSIVLLNIDSWGAGCKLVELSNSCEDGSKIEHSISDGKMEVFGVASSFHVAQLQVKLSKPIRLGQGRNIKITLKKCVAVQADGEPWLQKPCDIFISSTGQVEMLQNRY